MKPENLRCLSELFEEQVERTPLLNAVIYDNKSLTYQELNQRANQLAYFLIKKGVQPETPVGISLERSLEMIVGILGILKAQAAYLPLDPAYPKNNLSFMLQDASSPILLTKKQYGEKFSDFEGEIIFLDSDWDTIIKEDNRNPKLKNSASQLAYIIYTSGSTGTPKGVMVEHAGWHNYILSAQKAYGIEPGQRMLQFSSLSWDTSAEEIFPCLTGGGTLVLRPPEMTGSFTRFWQLCDSFGITILTLPTAFWNDLTSHIAAHPTRIPEKLRVVVIGGERAIGEMVNQWHKAVPATIQLFNTYGQTECTAVTTRCILSPNRMYDTVPIGSAVENVDILIANDNGVPVSAQNTGELYVGGIGVARGYLKREELTKQKFVTLANGKRYYRTGDLVRENSEGLLEYMGRLDAQIKIRGVRIEPGEVEAALLKHPAIRLAVVMGQPIELPRKLVAYMVLEDGVKKMPSDLRVWLRSYLSDAFMPSMFIQMESIPLTVNGKVDKRALPVLSSMKDESDEIHDAPTNEMEAMLLTLWRDLLKIPNLGIHDDFFEYGGDSLIVVQIITELEQKIEKLLPFSLIFHAPTVAQLAKVLQEEGAQSVRSVLVPVKTGGKRTPLFCVHADGGAFFYLNFAKYLADDQPFYGLQSRGLDANENPFTSLSDMCAHYIEEIRKVQPEGPYYIGGFSVGGIFAFEMAQQLTAQGQEVRVLAMLDAGAPDYPKYTIQGPSLTRKIKQFLRKNPVEMLKSSALKLSAKLQNLINNTRILLSQRMHNPLSPELRVHLVRRLNQRMGDQYKPAPYSGDLYVFCADIQAPNTVRDDSLGWNNYVNGNIYSYILPGDHETIFKEPNVQKLAEAVQKALIEAAQHHKGS